MSALFGRRFESAHLHMSKMRFLLVALALTGCIKNSTWAPRTIQTFDNNGQALARYLFTYDERGYRFTETKETYDANRLSWYKEYRISYAYDANGYLSGSTKEQLDSVTGKWLYLSRIQYHYDIRSALPETQIHQDFTIESQSWNNVFKDHYIRNETDQLLFVVREVWDGANWYNHARHSFSYDAQGKLLEEKTGNWDTQEKEWISASRQVYTYNKKKNAVKDTREFWNKEHQKWEQTGLFLYSYDSHGNAIEVSYIPATGDAAEDTTLIFYYNAMQSSIGHIYSDTGSFRGIRGTAEYFRQKR